MQAIMCPKPSHYSIWIVTPDRYVHCHAFDEVAVALQSGLRELGAHSEVVTTPSRLAETTIVLGAHLLPHAELNGLPTRLILFNLEQVSLTSRWFTPDYLSLLRSHTVWDYSRRNIDELAVLGVKAVHCSIGYSPELSRIVAVDEDIDVLFFGSLNHRRLAIIRELLTRGVNVKCLFGWYGQSRDGMIARSKLVLNVHFYDAQLFEIVRVSYLLANQRCVVSETGLDCDLELAYRAGVAFAHYCDIAETCIRLLRDPRERAALASAGLRCVRSLPQTDSLRMALEQSGRGWAPLR
jgi:hypothetical protein